MTIHYNFNDNYYKLFNHSGNTSDLKGELKFHFLLMLTYKFIPLDLITNIVLTSIFLLLNFYNKYKLYISKNIKIIYIYIIIYINFSFVYLVAPFLFL